MDGKEINVLYITDDGFAIPTAVSISSLKANRRIDCVYNVFVALDQVSTDNALRIKKLDEQGFYIKEIIVDSDKYSAMERRCNLYGGRFHVSRAALLKFDIADLVPELERVLYIDGDTIILDDLCDLYRFDLNGKTIAAVRDLSDTYCGEFSNYGKRIGLKTPVYFNSGVILFDLVKYKAGNVKNRLIDYRMNGKNEYMDQDAFNAVLIDETVILADKYNYLAFELLKGPFELLFSGEKKCSNSTITTYIKDQAIIHYASFIKPWKYHIPVYTDIFYQYFLLSPFSDVRLHMESMMDIMIGHFKNDNTTFRKLLPRDTIQRGESIVLYGAGTIGKRIYDEISIDKYCKVILWLDQDYKKYDDRVSSPDMLNNIPKETIGHVVIAIKSEMIVENVKGMLVEMGVPEEKIIWYKG